MRFARAVLSAPSAAASVYRGLSRLSLRLRHRNHRGEAVILRQTQPTPPTGQ